MPQISQLLRSALKTQLTQVTYGFNDRLAQLASAYGISPWAVDWSDTSPNFLFGRIDPAAIQSTSAFTYPLMTIDTLRSQHANRVKFATFAGPIIGAIEVHHSWDQEAVLADFSSYVDATEDAMIGALNDQNHQTWPGNLLWNGQVVLSRGPIRPGGYGWLQTATFTCQFELIT